jgi:hypothetical protein
LVQDAKLGNGLKSNNPFLDFLKIKTNYGASPKDVGIEKATDSHIKN